MKESNAQSEDLEWLQTRRLDPAGNAAPVTHQPRDRLRIFSRLRKLLPGALPTRTHPLGCSNSTMAHRHSAI